MAQVLVTESYLEDIADAIRDKNGTDNTYTPAQMAGAIEAIPDPSVLVQKSIIENGTYDPEDDSADGYSGVTVNVPNSYTASDEGKVVSSGALVSQTSMNVTENGTYDTTEKNEVVVNVPTGGGSPTLITKNITQNGTYNASSDNADGYSQVTVNVSGGGGVTYDAYRIWTASTGGMNAAVYVQKGQITVQGLSMEYESDEEAESVIYTSVRQTPRNFDNVFELSYPSTWQVTALKGIWVDARQYSNGQTAKQWGYSATIDFYLIDLGN